MRKVRHKNVVQFIGACTRKPNLCIVVEYMPGGSVYDYMRKVTAGADALRDFRCESLPVLETVSDQRQQRCEPLHSSFERTALEEVTCRPHMQTTRSCVLMSTVVQQSDATWLRRLDR